MNESNKAKMYDLRTKNISSDILTIKKLLSPEERILEVGSGTGRIILNLQKHGFKNITGIEIDNLYYKASLIKLESLNEPNIKIINTNFLHFSTKEKFNKIIFPFNVFSEFLAPEEKFGALSKAKELIEEGGQIILFNFVHDFKSWSEENAEYNFNIEDEEKNHWGCDIKCSRNLNKQLSTCNVTYKNINDFNTISDSYKMSLLTRNELLILFYSLNLQVINEYGSYDLDKFNDCSKIMIHCLTANM